MPEPAPKAASIFQAASTETPWFFMIQPLMHPRISTMADDNCEYFDNCFSEASLANRGWMKSRTRYDAPQFICVLIVDMNAAKNATMIKPRSPGGLTSRMTIG